MLTFKKCSIRFCEPTQQQKQKKTFKKRKSNLLFLVNDQNQDEYNARII